MFTDLQRKAWEAMQLGPLYETIPAALQATSPANPVQPATQVPVAQLFKQVTSKQVTEPTPPATSAEFVPAGSWDELAKQVSECRFCSLCESRTQTVFAAGKPGPALMIIGEAPGEEEDQTGEPFVGQSGNLLTNMLSTIGLSRSTDLVIVNALKCRPPANRNPSQAELDLCKPYLLEQIELARPKVILLTGKIAALALLGLDATLATLRAQKHAHRMRDSTVITVLVSYHPAYYLRRPSEKAKAWVDLNLLKASLDAQATGN